MPISCSGDTCRKRCWDLSVLCVTWNLHSGKLAISDLNFSVCAPPFPRKGRKGWTRNSNSWLLLLLAVQPSVSASHVTPRPCSGSWVIYDTKDFCYKCEVDIGIDVPPHTCSKPQCKTRGTRDLQGDGDRMLRRGWVGQQG